MTALEETEKTSALASAHFMGSDRLDLGSDGTLYLGDDRFDLEGRSPLVISLSIYRGLWIHDCEHYLTFIENVLHEASAADDLPGLLEAIRSSELITARGGTLKIGTQLLMESMLRSTAILDGAGSFLELRDTNTPAAGFYFEEGLAEDDLFSFQSDPVALDRSLKPVIDFSQDPDQLEVSLRLDQISQDLIDQVATDPALVFGLSSRQFEELMAELFWRQGFEVSLTPTTGDGGVDLYLIEHTSLGQRLTVVECKKYARHRPVGVSAVRQLLAVVDIQRANAGLLVTTSHFTRGANSLSAEFRFKLGLREYRDLKGSLSSMRQRDA
ncbi:MAG TPA: restriction endonuclease [Solirubrobacterales bacterium]|nr:restriction endonuclease [Solirubrobacterales bacterium]